MPLPQSFCCLPWCGASFSGPCHAREFLIDGALVRHVYPAMIDMHDILPRSLGGDKLDPDNNLPICHDCHMAHHDGRKPIEIKIEDGIYHVRLKDTPHWYRCRFDSGLEGA